MQDFDMEDIEEMMVSLELEDGTELECEVICIFEYEGQDYAALTPTDEKIEEIYFFGIELNKNGEEVEVELQQLEDDELLGALGEVFDEIMSEDDEIMIDDGNGNVYNIFDDEDGTKGKYTNYSNYFEDDDDGKWDEFINKKLD
ncbi:DUF1292 domain-containing protein [Eubacterium xylanophilum]|uniref:DUF1292 domain-containing protein n=1 Tax=Eubacterium xylanophilum TaxID=39497 RepID=UPI0004B2563B|nr:DUF1292 domain-containing protein [Eubacterium xylanophilum]